ncbi:thioesterase II family protein [Streptomyces clavuligerus]|uniref:Thioesterase n=1 Tax=Streptomyces clavuligerus TaxID=1901 RepID=E2QAB6_STRCL|nr:alpha/beta fold hydrolase [Streptomyces clavuligerus]ANW17665.1 thioesterase [Streptomyces clavuligerus]AXU12213.1 thioesterase [Streptomyces clavuligerus]EFG09815.1 Thioesterase [Streptomyces clavuligerus]MBY6302083.1 thioesterase [Streptomyces clavuligerus]QCS04995.1 thioesterase [Streptomyces clavuligerus]
MTATRTVAPSEWFRAYSPRPAAHGRLICFPHAGGGASAFRELAGRAPQSLEVTAVQYPGRQDRFSEPMPRSMDELTTALAEAVVAGLDRPTALFGHSMGATVAFEVARKLRRTHPGFPVRLFASARRAPHTPLRTPVVFDDDEQAVAYIRSLGGQGAPLLADPELRAMAAHILRADLRLLADYRCPDGPPLTCPITVIRGADDPSCTLEDAREWGRHTVAGLGVETLPGGHFYLETAGAELANLLTRRLTADLPGLAVAH